MATSHRELQPINVQLPSPNPSMNDIPVGLPTPSSLAVHDEQLTVRPRPTTFCPFANLCPLESEPFITLVTENRLP